MQMSIHASCNSNIDASTASFLASISASLTGKEQLSSGAAVWRALQDTALYQLTITVFPYCATQVRDIWHARGCEAALDELYERCRTARREGWVSRSDDDAAELAQDAVRRGAALSGLLGTQSGRLVLPLFNPF